ncbi:MAG: tetratricopeptide repeat protein, partial [Phycisphaerae bacterium]|nr:tetratricopeptide repeat protein [Phycisphaerae bacterium]
FDELLTTASWNLSLAAFGQEKYDSAAKEFGEFIEHNPKSELLESAYFHRAQSLFQTKKYTEAAADYDTVIGLKGELSPSARFEKALAIYKAGDLKKAAEAFIESGVRDETSKVATKARLYAGNCYYEAGEYESAVTQFDKMIASGDPGAPKDEAKYWKGQAQLKLNRASDAAATFAEAIKSHPETPRMADLKLSQADALLAQNKLADAAAAYEDVAKRFPQHEATPRSLYNAALARHSNKQLAESQALCERFIADFPTDKLLPRVLFIAGENQFLQGKYDAAAPQYRQLLDKFPADATPDTDKARLRLAWAFYFQKKYTDAMPSLAGIGDKADDAIRREASYLKANCLLELKSDNEAADALDAFLAANGPKTDYLDDALFKIAMVRIRQGKRDAAAPHLERFVKDCPDSPLRPQVEYQLAEISLGAKKYADTIVHYQEVIRRDGKGPLAPYAAFGQGLCYYEQTKWKEAADAFASVSNYPGSDKLQPQAIYRTGLCFQKQEQWAVAEKSFTELVTRFPKDPYAVSAIRAIGLGQEKLKLYDKAVATFNQLITDYADSKDLDQAYYELAWCYQATNEKEKMLAAFKALSDKYPNSPLVSDAYYHLAEQSYFKKDYDKALELYQSAYAAAKDTTGRKDNSLYRLGWCFWMKGKFDDAAEKFDKLVNDLPSSELVPDALLNAGEAYLRAAKPSAAVDRLTKLVDGPAGKDFKYLPEAMVRLGEAQIALGQHDKALETLKKVKEKYPKDDAAASVEFAIGLAQFHMKDYDASLRTLLAALENPGKASGETQAKGQFYIGESYFASGQLREALKAYLRVTVIYAAFPEWVSASYYQLGQVYVELAKKAAGDNPQEANILKGEASQQFQAVIEKFPTSKWADAARKAAEGLK